MFPSVRTVLSLLLSSLLLASLLPAILKGQTANRAHESGAASVLGIKTIADSHRMRGLHP